VSILHRWFEIAIEADPAALAPGFADNLIVSAFLERPVANKKGKGTKIRRYAIGTLPAVPIRVVRKQE